MLNVLNKILSNKLWLTITIFILLGGSYWEYKSFFSTNAAVRYVLAKVQKGTLIVSISGNGQVSASNQVDIKPKASGDIVYIGVRNGEGVKAGMIIAQINSRDAQKTVRDAEANLEAAKLSLEKLKKPADQLSILQAENALIEAHESKQKTEDDLKKTYEDVFNTVSNAFLDLPGIITGLHNILFESTLGGSGQWNIDYYANSVKTYDEKALQYKEDTRLAYQKARAAYDKNFENYKQATRFSDHKTIESLINETYDTTKSIAEAVKNVNNFIQFYKDKLIERDLKANSLSDTHLSTLNTYTGKTNTHLLNLLSAKRTIQTDKETISSAERTIAEKTESLAKLKAGADALDIQSAELAIKQRENSLLDAKEKLADYYIRAPFDGVIAKINIKKGDPVSSSVISATLITRQKFAEISLNEVDVAKIKVDQKATLTFDALPELSISGEVVEIDSVGTISQGVVTYNVKIAFDTQNNRVKTAMSVSAAIVIEAKSDVLLVSNSAIKSQSGMSFVEMPQDSDISTAAMTANLKNATGIILKNIPRREPIKTGISNDEFTEILSGLKEADIVVTNTINPQTAANRTQQQNSSFRIPGLPGGGSRSNGREFGH